jgi:hypothetical protein
LQPDVDVDIEGLRRTGVKIKTPLISVDSAIQKELPHLSVSGSAAGWDTVPALGDTAMRWSDYLRDLGLRVRKVGEDLLTTADQFEAAEQQAVHSFNFPIPAADESPAPSYNFPIR